MWQGSATLCVARRKDNSYSTSFPVQDAGATNENKKKQVQDSIPKEDFFAWGGDQL